MREDLSFEKERPSRALPKKTGTGFFDCDPINYFPSETRGKHKQKLISLHPGLVFGRGAGETAFAFKSGFPCINQRRFPLLCALPLLPVTGK